MSQVLQSLIATARKLVADGLVRGAGGNVSAREDDLMWISPSGGGWLGHSAALPQN